ncbi:MAG: hypothetical protein AAF633_02050 [Chloroflexota bacterium]
MFIHPSRMWPIVTSVGLATFILLFLFSSVGALAASDSLHVKTAERCASLSPARACQTSSSITQTITHTTSLVDLGGEIGNNPTVALIGSKPAYFFFNRSKQIWQFVQALEADGSTWAAPVDVYQTNSSSGFGTLHEINGKPAVAFFDSNTRQVNYIQANDAEGSSWQTPVIIDTFTGSVNLKVELSLVNGHPAVAYAHRGPSSIALRYARAADSNGISWSSPITADNSSPFTGYYADMQIVDGAPAVTYFNWSTKSLMFVRAQDSNGTSWGTPQILDTTINYPIAMEIVNGQPAVSYRNTALNEARYLRATAADGSSWGSPVTLGILGQTTNLDLELVNNIPTVVYREGLNTYFQQANDLNGSSWLSATVLHSNSSGYDLFESIGLIVADGRPTLTGLNFDRKGLLFARADDSLGSQWSTFPNIYGGLAGDSLSVAEIASNPAVSFNGTSGLQYMRATDRYGTVWETPITIDPAPGIGEFNQLLSVNDRPAIAYFNSFDYDGLYYVQANDQLGRDWPDPTQAVSTTNDIEQLSAAVVSGRPALAYFDDDTRQIEYVRATSSAGTAWGSPVVITSNVSIPNSSSNLHLIVIDGQPAVAFSADSRLNFIKATDEFGSSWGSNTVIAADDLSNGFSFDFHEGELAIAHFTTYSTTQAAIAYLRAADSSASSWESAVNAVVKDRVLRTPFLTWFEGVPAIVYDQQNPSFGRSLANRAVQADSWGWVRASNSDGSTWVEPDPLPIPETLPTFSDRVAFFASDQDGFGLLVGSVDMSYSAYQIETSYPLSIVRAGSGSGTVTSLPAGINCGISCTMTVLEGETITLTATADDKSVFSGWSGLCSDSEECTVTVTQSTEIEATFDQLVDLTVSIVDSGVGVVTSDPAGLTCETTCSAEFLAGTEITLTAAVKEDNVFNGYAFAGWSDSRCADSNPICRITLDSSGAITATFLQTPEPTPEPTPALVQLTVTKAGDGDGLVTSQPAGIDCGASCTATFDAGSSVTLTAVADPGSNFIGWSAPCTGSAPCTVTLVEAAAVEAIFSRQPDIFLPFIINQ